MSALIDIRNGATTPIESIQFADESGPYDAFKIEKYSDEDIKIVSENDNLYLSKSAIAHLIKALQKAQELGWER